MEFFSTKKSEKKFILGLIAAHAAMMIFLAFHFDGTGDEGDSIFHFLYSKYAFDHPENLLNHWAKPVFVLVTAPIAQFGFIAMKIFNILLLSATCWLTWLIGQKLAIKNAWLPVLVVMTAPMNVYLTLSGLTEPLFTFWMLLGIYFFINKQNLTAVLWLSFLPFVRSEGLIIFCVVAIYLLLKNHWKLIPLLMTGHIVYAFVGYPYFQDLFWVFNKMSYAVMKSSYGAGTLGHFLVRMPEVIGGFQAIFLVIGLVAVLPRLKSWAAGFADANPRLKSWGALPPPPPERGTLPGATYSSNESSAKRSPFRGRRGLNFISTEELWLIYGIAVAYFVAHSLFWYLGIFNSFGLMRVMISIVPLIGIIIVQGINFLFASQTFTKPSRLSKRSTILTAISICLIFFGIKNVKPDYHLALKPIQKTQKALAEKYGERYQNYTVFFDAIYPAVVFDKDWFDASEHRLNRQFFTKEPIPKKSIAIWDSWFSPVEKNVDYEDFANDPRFKLIECFEEKHPWDKKMKRTCLFEFDSTFSIKNPLQNGEKTVLIENDFENKKLRSKVDSTQSVSGKYSLKISKKMPAWGSQRMFMNAFEDVPNSKIKISFQAFLPKGSEAVAKEAVVRCEFISRYQIFKEIEVPVFTEKDAAGSWKTVELVERFPTRKDVEDRVRIFVKNKNEKEILVDDLKVEWISEK